jgi:trk system potassium uptake protein TrkA
MELRQGQVSLAKLKLPEDDPMVGKRVRDIVLPENTALAIVIRDGGVMLPQPDDVLRTDDEMLFFAGGAVEDQIRALVHGATKPLRGR